jgi:3-deoxy-manno-octulosonate cytidylyltransferase (CMP-KDO synthetase)
MPRLPSDNTPGSEDVVTQVAVIIPARLESTRLARKLLLARTGRPLIAHTVERVLEARRASDGLVSRVIVAADDESLVDAARAAGADAVMTRRDHLSGTDRIAEAAAGLTDEIVVNIQGDEPEIEPDHVLAAARVLGGKPEPMGTLAYPIRDRESFDNPNLVKVVLGHDGNALYFSRAPVPFPRDGDAEATERLGAGIWGLKHMGVYAYRREFLMRYAQLPPSSLEVRERLEQLRAVEAGEKIRVAVVDPPRGHPVDTEEDYEAFVARVEAARRRS